MERQYEVRTRSVSNTSNVPARPPTSTSKFKRPMQRDLQTGVTLTATDTGLIKEIFRTTHRSRLEGPAESGVAILGEWAASPSQPARGSGERCNMFDPQRGLWPKLNLVHSS